MRLIFRTLVFLLFAEFSYSQQIQWSSEITYQFNEFSAIEYSAKQVLGIPDSDLGKEDPRAYKMKSDAAIGVLVSKFSVPQYIQQVVVVENYFPGRITEVNVIDEKNEKHNVYKKNPQQLDEIFRILAVNFPITQFKVSKVEVKLNTLTKKGWAQIDAIGISSTGFPFDLNSIQSTTPVVKLPSSDTDLMLNFSTNVENLGENVNTKVTETKPIISADGKQLYFCRQNYSFNSGGKKDDQDIWFSEFKNGEWSYATNIGKPLNDANPNGVSSVSADGNTLLLINEYQPGGEYTQGASLSHRIKGGWSKPEKLKIEKFLSKGTFLDFCLGSSGKILIMAIDRHDSNGDQDLYVSFSKGENNWSEPLNLGKTLNTGKAEFSPFLAADEKTLYFASDGYAGLGGSDIYYTKRLDNTWQNWSVPANLGEKVNSPDWDGYYSVSASGDYAYLVSTRNSISNSKDIYRIGLPRKYKPEPVVMLKGTVFNAKTKLPIASKIIFENLPNGKEEGVAISSPDNGSYKIILPRGKEYGFLAQSKGFLSLEENIDLSELRVYKEIRKDLYLVPIEIGQTVALKNLFFIKGKSVLLESSYPELDRLVTVMKENKSIEIELGGHTDNQGNEETNLDLAEGRVKVVKAYIVSKGIQDKRLRIKTYGESKPVASNATEETRMLNRRVEVTILKY